MPRIGSGGLVQAAKCVAAALCGALAVAAPALAAPPAYFALVIGESTYAALPPLPACAGSARTVAAILRHAGYKVAEKLDASNGEAGAALTKFARHLAEAPGSTAVAYFCGYALGLNGRNFLLPVSATIERPFDVLSQGLVASSLLDAIGSGHPLGSLLLLDVFARPGDTAPLGLKRLVQALPASGQGYLAVVENSPGDSRTPLAAALVGGFAAPATETSALIADLERRLGRIAGLRVAGVQIPSAPGFLAGGPAPRPPSIAKQPAPVAAAPAPTQAVSPPTPAAPTPAVRAAPPVMPEESQMTEADRRRVQAALGVLGYYGGRVDGQFGAETRVAIRRYQHEIGAELTGRLTPEQAGRLVGGRS